MAVESNGLLDVGGVSYLLVFTPANKFQMYKSTDSGATWATSGALATPTGYHGGMAQAIVGTKIYVGYSWKFSLSFSAILYARSFDTATQTWSAEQSFNCGGSVSAIEGPYKIHVRSDNSMVMIIGNASGTSGTWAVTFDGVTTFGGPYGPFDDGAGGGNYMTSVLKPDNSVAIFFYTTAAGNSFYYQSLSPTNVVSSRDLVSAGQLMDWNGYGLGNGFLSGATYYFAAGLKTAAYPTIWGQPVIVSGSPGAWIVGPLIDTDPAVSDYSVYWSALFSIAGNLVFVYRAIDSAGANYIQRIGSAPTGSEASPAAWTWETSYALTTPVPLVPGKAAPYSPELTQGASSGLTQSGDDLRLATTLLSGGVTFVSYLLSYHTTAPVPPPVTVSSLFYLNVQSLAVIDLPPAPVIDSAAAVRQLNLGCLPPRLKG
jgi:hypothetical protein